MKVKFPIPELEKIVHPDNLIDTLDSLLDNRKLSSYYYNWEDGVVLLEIPDSVVIDELFSGYDRGEH